ncbi:MAG: hypothetical protein AAGG06_17045 [Pseudomonadota bacterium]
MTQQAEAESGGNQVVAMAEQAAGWLAERWEYALFLTLLGATRWILKSTWAEPKSRQDLIAFIRRGTWQRWYQRGLGKLLAWTDRRFLTEDQFETLPAASWQRAWSVRLYDRCLLLAVAYPVLTVLLQWAVWNIDGQIGDLTVLAGGQPWHIRAAALGGIATVFLFAILSATRRTAHGKVLFGVSAFAVAVAVVAAIAGAFAGAFAFAAAVAAAFAAAAAGAFAFAAAVAAAFAFAVAGAAAFAGAAAVAGAAAIERRPTALRYGMLTLGAAALLTLGARFGDSGSRTATLLIFLGVLPLVNAVFDFGSIGLTRFALRNGLRRVGWRTLLWSLGDLFAAAVLFLGLGFVAILAIQGLNAVAQGDLLDLSAFFADLRPPDPDFIGPLQEAPSYGWLYATFLSTLIPTALHLMVAVWAVGPALLGVRSRSTLASWLDHGEGHFLKREGGLLILALWTAFAIALPVTLLAWLGHLAFFEHHTVGPWLLNIFEGFHRLLA